MQAGAALLVMLVSGLAVISGLRHTRGLQATQNALKAANERLEKLAAKQSVLLHEMNHRIGNSLQLITSMIGLQAAATPDPDANGVLRQAAERVIAVAHVHRRLYTSDDIQYVQMQPYLEKLLEDQQMAARDRGRELRVEIEDVKLSTDRAISVGIIVTELVTNSLKYAYPKTGGPSRVTLAPFSSDALTLAVEDDGVGQNALVQAGGMSVQGAGVGSRIVDAMAKSLGAHISQEADGTGFRSVVVFPRALEAPPIFPAGAATH